MSDGVWWPEFEQWMREHGIDPVDTAEIAWRPPHAGNRDGLDEDHPQCIQVLSYKRNDQGQRYLEDGEPATETRVVPMRSLPAVEVIRYR